EGYGFCGRGEGAAFSEDGALERAGRLPVNTSGGGLSEAYVHGFNLITEGVRQMRGTSLCQVKDAEACLVTGGEGVPTSAMILRGWAGAAPAAPAPRRRFAALLRGRRARRALDPALRRDRAARVPAARLLALRAGRRARVGARLGAGLDLVLCRPA